MRISDNHNLNLLKLNNYNTLSKLLNELKVGDVFKGNILKISNNKVTLKTVNGIEIEAKLSSDINLKVGQQLNFKVQSNNNNQLFIKPLAESVEKPNVMINALKSAGLPITEENVELVKGLMANHLPIDKGYVTSLTNLLKNNDTTPKALLFMIKNNLEINDTNIQQLNNFINNTDNITDQLNQLINELANAIERDEGNEIINKIIDYVDKDILEQSIVKDQPMLFKADDAKKLVDTDKMRVKVDKKVPYKEIDNVLKDLNIPDEDKYQVKKDIIKNQLIKEFFIKVKDNDVLDKVEDLYNNISEKLDDIENQILNVRSKDLSLNSNSFNERINDIVSNINKSIDFLNSLNENISLLHIPLQFSNSLSGGNLFLIRDKKSESEGNKTSIKTALLSLDLAYLGHLEAYIGVVDKKISLNIGVENDHLKKLFQNHIEKLNGKLIDYGYIIDGIFVNVLESKYDFTQIHTDDTIKEKIYSFDMKA